MFMFRSGKNYGSYTVTEILPPPAVKAKNVSFRERFQNAFQEVDDVFVVRDEGFQYSKGTTDLLSPEYGEIIEKMENAPSGKGEADDEGTNRKDKQGKTTRSSFSDQEKPSEVTRKKTENRAGELSGNMSNLDKKDSSGGANLARTLERASWEEMEIRDREYQAVEEHASQVRLL